MKSFEEVEQFYEYLIIGEDGWKGIKDDAPESAKKAYENFLEKEKENASKGIKS